MIRVFVFLCAWVTSCVLASAAAIPVRSGAHEDFSRIVLDVTESAEWSIDQDPEGARIRIVGHDDGFDTSRVFERIDRSFIDAVTSSESEVSIAFNCNCVAEAFRAGDRMIVVDVALRKDFVSNSGTQEDETDSQLASPSGLRFPSLNLLPSTNTIFSDLVLSDQSESKAPAPSALASAIKLDPKQQLSERSPLGPARGKLAEHIGRAATSGLLKPSGTPIATLGSRQRSQIDTRVFEPLLTDESSIVDEDSSGFNLRVTSSRDPLEHSGEGIRQLATSGSVCPDPSILRVQDWGHNSDFAPRIAALRSNLFSELDRMDPGIAKDMVRTYLHFGFGAEALQLIDANGDVFEDSQILREVSEILEFGTVEQDGYLGKFLECDSDFSLWAILASQDLNAADVLNTSAAVRTLNSLPIHMRQYLAPLLSRKLLEYSDEDGASAALRSLERTAQPLPPAAEIAKAEIELKQGEVSDAQVRLRGVVETNGQQSAEALVRYVDTHFAAGRVIEQDVATLVEAYATEFKDSPLGEELRRTHVLALAKSGQFDGAFVALGDLPLNRVKDKSVDLRSAVLQVLSSDASDATFAEHAFENISRHRGAISQNAALSIANRLIDLGFFAEAEHLLSTQNDIPQTSGNRVLRAKISLGLARPFEAQAVLRGLKGEEVSRLRAKASILAGDHDQAHEILSDLGDEKSSLEAAWLSNDWRTNVASNAPVLGAAAEVASLQVDVPTELDGMLTRLQTTLQDSADARNVIEQLIATTGSDD